MLLHVPQYPQLFNSQLEIACRIQISLVYFASMKWSALSYKSSDWDEVVLCIISELLVRKCYCNLAWKHCLSHCHHLGEFFLPIFSWCTKIRHGWESNFNFCTLIKTARVKSLVFDDQNTHTYLFCLGLHGCAGQLWSVRPVVTDVLWFVCLLINCAKMAELIEMPFGMWTQVGLRNHVLDSSWNPQGK